MSQITERNKEVVVRFNQEFIQGGDMAVFQAIIADDFYNHAAPPGESTGPEGVSHFVCDVILPAFPDLQVEILHQVAEGDVVMTHKKFYGTHQGELFGIPPTHKGVEIEVMDVIRLRDGQYIEHWGVSTMAQAVQSLVEK